MTLESQLNQTAGEASHAAALIAALGDPSQYEYTGQCIDAGQPVARCACGHQIRYCFIIRHKVNGNTAQVGSTCIGHFEGINPGLYTSLLEAVADLEARIAEEKAKVRRAAQDAEIQPLRRRRFFLRLALGDIQIRAEARHVRTPREVWIATRSHGSGFFKVREKPYKSPSGLKKYLEREIATLEGIFQKTNYAIPAELEPVSARRLANLMVGDPTHPSADGV